jgi:hypothetical protein
MARKIRVSFVTSTPVTSSLEGELRGEAGADFQLTPCQIIEPEPLTPTNELADRIRSKGPISSFAVALTELSDTVSTALPNPPENCVCIIVKLRGVCEC